MYFWLENNTKYPNVLDKVYFKNSTQDPVYPCAHECINRNNCNAFSIDDDDGCRLVGNLNGNSNSPGVKTYMRKRGR